MKKIKPFGTWSSPLTAELALANIRSVSFTESTGDSLVWVEDRPSEGRTVLVQWKDGEQCDITPPPYSVRSRVHEYGGKCYTVSGNDFWFVHTLDQNIYHGCVDQANAITRVTDGDANERFVDLVVNAAKNRMFAVRESHQDDRQVVNDICEIDLDTCKVKVRYAGHDFYAAPRLSPNEEQIAFFAWDHPNMPFDGTQLYVANLHEANAKATIVAGGANISIGQPEWMADGKLAFVSDENGFWNLYVYDELGVECIMPDDAEYGDAQWGFGGRLYQPLDERYLVATRNVPEGKSLVIVDSVTKLRSPYESAFCAYGSLTKHKGGIVFVAGRKNGFAQVIEKKKTTGELEVLAVTSTTDIPVDTISEAELIRYVGSQDAEVFAYFYRPKNGKYEADPSARPPLLVLSHGGPTSSTGSSFSLGIQYFTSRGWAVLDVNYGGSTGYGREYRNRLRSNWGIVDVGDCMCGVRHLIARDEIHPNHVAIKGGSAGGYTTLQGLTTSSVFKVGSSHYGVADARILAADTHKFESKYIHQLIPEDQIDARSPIHHVENLDCPVIFFQGDEDRVVPPNQAEMMFEKLKQKGIPTALFLFEGEGHGFRQAENIKTCMNAEYLFFAKVFGFQLENADYSCFERAETANLELP